MNIEIGKIYSNRVVIFIDILGFKHACSSDVWSKQGPDKAHSDYETLISMAYGSNDILTDGPTWEAYFALSDSVFLTSDDPNSALFAVSTVFHAIYSFSYLRGLPAMVRGGIGFGDVVYDVGIYDVASTNPKIGNLYGPAVVEAVQMEKTGSGPRLFCTTNLPTDFLGGIPANLLTYTPETNCYEVLWGALSVLKIRHVRELFKAAWQAYTQAAMWSPEVRGHYVEGLCFAIRCLSHYYKTPRNRKNSSFERDLEKLVRPVTNYVFQMEDWLRIDDVIRWEIKEQQHSRFEWKTGMQGKPISK